MSETKAQNHIHKKIVPRALFKRDRAKQHTVRKAGA
jgi:hypothetical protein